MHAIPLAVPERQTVFQGDPSLMIRNCLIATLVLVIHLSAASWAQAPSAPAGTSASNAKQKDDSPVVARVYGVPITEEQVLNGISQLAQQQQLSPEQMKQKDILFFKEVLDRQIGMYLLKNEAKAQQITVDKTKVDEYFQNLIKNFPSEADFRKVLELQGVTEATLRAAIEDVVISQQVLDANVKDVPAATEADVKKFYDDNPQYFQKPESVHAAHILLRVAPDSTPEMKAETKKKLEAIRADIESTKITFAEAATKYSEDKGSAASGGDLGSFPRGRVAKPLEDMAFGTKPGSLSPVFETQFGYHIVSVSEITPPGKATLDESRNNIQKFLESQSKQAAAQKYISGLREKAKIEILMTEDDWKQRRAGKSR
jgi:peptidyl-prolyl cis-trans isomerase C